MGYMSPFPRGTRVSQVFGSSPLNGVNPRGGHTGTDYAVVVGTPVYAAADGIIEHSDWFKGYYNENPWWLTSMGGDTLVLNAGDKDYTFVYAHLLNSTIPKGQWVKKGQIIGFSGNSGTATTGPHCHVEALPPSWNYQNGTFGRVNPGNIFNEFPGEITLQGAIKEEDEMPSVEEIFNYPFKREGGVEGEITLGGLVRWYDANNIGDRREIATLKEVVNQLAVKQGVVIDYDAIAEKVAKKVNDDAAQRLAD